MSGTTSRRVRTVLEEDLADRPFRAKIGIILFLTGLFFLNFIARLMMAPLMPTIEQDLGIGHGQAGSMFLLILSGYFCALIGSGFVSSKVGHRWNIILSAVGMGLAMLVVSLSQTLLTMRLALVLLGLTAGIYLPSGIAVITTIVRQPNWGKALAIHEGAPNLSFIMAPLAAEILMGWLSWRQVLALVGILSILGGLAFIRFGLRTRQRGQAPGLASIKTLVSLKSFWVLVVIFSMGTAAQIGLFSMLPLYLVSDRGMDRTWANTIIGLTRISCIVVAFGSGWVSDRVGQKRTLMMALLLPGLATIILPLLNGHWLVLMLFVQPALSAAFFPPAFAAIARCAPPQARNLAVSLTVPLAFLVGGGVLPTAMGYLAEAGSFSLSIVLLGIYITAGTWLVRFLRFFDENGVMTRN